MIQIVEKPYFLPSNEVDKQFEGKMVLLVCNSESMESTESKFIAAHSDGNKDTEYEDRKYLLDILRQKYHGRGKLVTGYVYDGSNFVCI